MLRHAELVASARKDEGPISIGGMLQILQKLVCGLLEHNQVCRAPRLRLVSRSLWHLLNNFKLRGLLACTLPAEIAPRKLRLWQASPRHDLCRGCILMQRMP